MSFLPRADVVILLRGRVRHIFQALGHTSQTSHPDPDALRHFPRMLLRPPPTRKPIVHTDERVRVLYTPHPPSVKKVGARGKAGERMW